MQVIPIDLYESLEELDPKTKAVILKLIKYWGEIVRREDFLDLNEEVKKLTKTVAELAEAQKSAEERLTRLEKTVAELAEAQKRTEEKLEKLIDEHRKTRKQLGGLAHSIGYFI
jgi:chromosome segregation ATPase